MAASSSSGTKRQREVASAGPGTSSTPPVSDPNDIPRPTFTLSPDKFNLKCKVGSKCKLKEDLKYIEECLSDHPDGIMWFQNSQFAPLFDVASDMDMVLTPLWMLLTRIVDSPDHSEIWFVVNGIPIRYSLLEHAIMSGLNCSRYPAASKVVEDDNFSRRYLSPKGTVKILREQLKKCVICGEVDRSRTRRKSLKKAAKKVASSSSDKTLEILPSDKLKLALLYLLVSVFFIPPHDDSPIDSRLLAIVDDLEFAKTYPWGRLSYSVMMDQLKTLDLKKKLVAANPQCNFRCFVLPLMLLPFECIPVLSPMIGRLRENMRGQLPRMCKWTTKLLHKRQYPTLSQILMLVGNTQNIKSLLQATPEELATDHMQSFVPFDHANSKVHDPTTKLWTEILEKGGRIVFDDIFRIDLESRHSILPVSKIATIIDDEGRRPEKENVECEAGKVAQDSVPGVSSIPMNTNDMVMKVLRELIAKGDLLSQKIDLLSQNSIGMSERLEKVESVLKDLSTKVGGDEDDDDGVLGEDEGVGGDKDDFVVEDVDEGIGGDAGEGLGEDKVDGLAMVLFNHGGVVVGPDPMVDVVVQE